ncbi:hypothetical protein ATCM_05445 [Stenotrophomonas sp. ATCM1_4]|uniref:hypothetical protein n=1 Tax=Stenotrophomonas sp. ATCM1_4 TaxID=2259330 RepID=UPI00104BCE2C|nr:hypothetical protein [Stenotrophomonas sp. ATCM1_4]TDB27140.1 hypothetical protein ATCM_05445 [Stenotrophomonas sp. ATCM1_4]
MYAVILLKGQNRFARERWESLPARVEYEGHGFSLRAGPHQPPSHGLEFDPVAVYAPDELTEEEFQEIYALNAPHIAELRATY